MARRFCLRMSLTFRPTGLSAPLDGDCKDYVVFSGEWRMGYIFHEAREGTEKPRAWFWSIHSVLGTPADMPIQGVAPTLQSAQADLEAAWRKWLAWAELEEADAADQSERS